MTKEKEPRQKRSSEEGGKEGKEIKKHEGIADQRGDFQETWRGAGRGAQGRGGAASFQGPKLQVFGPNWASQGDLNYSGSENMRIWVFISFSSCYV